jgi:hypothetical protein
MSGSPYTECPPGESCTFTARGPGSTGRVRFAFNNLVEGTGDDTDSDDGATTVFDPNLARIYVASISMMLVAVLLILFMRK